jgi:hypothetical protein
MSMRLRTVSDITVIRDSTKYFKGDLHALRAMSLGRVQIGTGRFVDQPCDDRLALGDLSRHPFIVKQTGATPRCHRCCHLVEGTGSLPASGIATNGLAFDLAAPHERRLTIIPGIADFERLRPTVAPCG